ncbi:two-component sensor histidine kinase [Nocardioides baekrokdamisoli]|uniref:histidine kinase n=1 Tax=Nocardioides baekrokdamisoli TaxID=1804624 RepID=A0A3G9J622_9ACTN|nr:HAMP domain-containing sensor histidine kinase [Nocardioides baekrokdamisoli]BBH18459.1 two-component sensor histidine kinase [Nocardioides baekrokdamisoli]
MTRSWGLSARLKLTLSYAGFLMVAGAILLLAAWEFLIHARHNGLIFIPGYKTILVRQAAPFAATALGFLLLFGLSGGWLLAGRMLAPLNRIAEATRLASAGSLTHRIALEGPRDEFRELADAFDIMLARLEDHVAEQQRFAANASHELRTPLAITRTMLEVARRDPAAVGDEFLERLQSVNNRAIELTEALLLLSRAEQGAFTSEVVDLSLASDEAVEALLPVAARNGIRIEASTDAAYTSGSAALITQLAVNLIHNAIVHNLPKHGTVQIATSTHPTHVEFVVENTGPLVDPHVVAQLTEPFHRGTERVHHDQAGVGLGLAVVQRIAEAHNGTLTLRPRPGGGLHVSVRLPAAPRHLAPRC